MPEEEDEELLLAEEEEEVVIKEPDCKKKYKVLVTNQRIPGEALALLRDWCEVHFLPPPGDQKQFMRYSLCMDGILLDDPSLVLDREFFRGAGLGLKAVSVVGWHGEQINIKEAEKRRVRIGVCPSELSADSTAEVAVGMAILLCRRFKEGNNALLRGVAEVSRPDYLLGLDLKDSTCGIIGLGKLGVSIAVRLQALWPKKIIYYSRRVKKAGTKLGIDRILLNDLVEMSDVIFFCLPCNSITRGMINKELIWKMKKCCFLVNPSHGGLFNINDLYCALRKGEISGAALDAEIADAPSPKHPIHRLDNFFFLPTVGRSSALVRLRMYMTAVENVISALIQKEMIYPYPPEDSEESVETEEERIVREAEEERLRLIMEEQREREREERRRLREIERIRLVEEMVRREEEARLRLEEEMFESEEDPFLVSEEENP